VVTREHERYYEEVLRDVPEKNLIVQPQDDGSTFAVLYAALRLAKSNPSAVLTFFPADFHAADAENFMTSVRSAIAAVREHRKLVLLGTKPESDDPGREWIELDPATPANEPFNVWSVRRFLNRTTVEEAQHLASKGALWNSSVMAGTAGTFLRKIRLAAPEIYSRIIHAIPKIGTPAEGPAIQRAYYSNYMYTNFSEDVLAKSGGKLAAVAVPGSKRAAAAVKEIASSAVPKGVVKSAAKHAVAGLGY
jgi:mannose-1-phosphate guanylyltransferase